MTGSKDIHLSIHGVGIRITSNSEWLLENIRRDFEYFNAHPPSSCHIEIEARLSKVPPVQSPKTSLWIRTGKFSCYEHDHMKEIWYPTHGKVLFRYKERKGQVYSDDERKLHSLTYFMIRSLVGELLEERGYHRIHALGVSMNGTGGVLVAPVRGGKTTLALELLKREGVKLISEDTPLIDRNLCLHPFPIRIGVRTDTKLDIPPHLLRDFRGVSPSSDPKKLIDISLLGARVEKEKVRLAWLMILRLPEDRSTPCTISRAGRATTFKALAKFLVLGLGVCQGKEFFVKKDPRDMATKGALLARRLKISLDICSSVTSYSLNLSTDPHQNAEVVKQFMDSLSPR